MSRRLNPAVFGAVFGALLLGPSNAFAHAVVYPKNSATKAYEKYTLRVPNERDVATTRVEIRFPKSVRVVSFADVPGWTLEVISDSARRIIGAAWTGSLAPQRFAEFPFVAVNPEIPVRLVWPVYQTYSSGERVDWTGRDDAKAPASQTLVAREQVPSTGVLLALWVCLGALVLSVAGLVLALRQGGSSGGFQPGS